MNINYLTDTKGNKVAVQIPFDQWSRLMEDFNRFKQYYELKQNLTISFKEIEEIERGDQDNNSYSCKGDNR